MRRVVTKIWVRGGWRDEEGTGQRYGLEEDGGCRVDPLHIPPPSEPVEGGGMRRVVTDLG